MNLHDALVGISTKKEIKDDAPTVKAADLKVEEVVQGEELKLREDKTPGAKPSEDLSPEQKRQFKLLFKRGRS
tara:strand:+ start:223 stop:441 length:219 start_codon:yes stop_codon:yes gene_type:complete